MSKVTKEEIDILVEDIIKVDTFEAVPISDKIVFKTLAILPKPILRSIVNVAFKGGLIEYSDNIIQQPPASFLLKIADLLPKKYQQDLQQNISDMRLEYCEALLEKKFWRAKCIVGFYYIGLGWSVVMWISDKAKEVVGIIPKKN
jgi:hypothetical protein